MMFLSVLSNLVANVDDEIVDKLETEEDKLITNVLIDFQNRIDMMVLKEQSILNDYVNSDKIALFRKIGKKNKIRRREKRLL